jgi:two-component system, cell cycle sensor histidine kinase and response regulator CckA
VIRDIPTRWLLLLAFLCAGLLPLMTVALVSYGTGRSELRRQAVRQLESVRDNKRAQLTRFFKERRRDVDLLARDPYLLAAFTELEQSFRASGGAGGGRFTGHDRRRFKAPESYLAVHGRHYPYLSRFVDQRGYYDLLLLDGKNGEICFSVEKERDFAAVVAEQPTALRDVWREVIHRRREVLSDTRPYPPSANAAAQFVAAPIERGGRVVGVVALQIGLAEVDAIVGELSGMGRTGDTRLVGSDFLPRSDSARERERTVQAAFLSPKSHAVVNEASRRALAGETGSMPIIEQDGRRVLAAWAPFDGVGARWALVTQIDESEINAQIDRALNPKVITLLATSVVAVVLLALLLSLFLSRSISSVGTQLVRLCDAVTRGDLSQRVREKDVPVDFRRVVHRINELVDAFVARLDSLPVPVLLVDPDLHVRFANAAACELKGRGRAQLIGRSCREAFDLGRACDERCLVKQAMESRLVVCGEVAGRDAQAQYLVTASPMLDSGGAVVGGFEVVVDRSEARRVEREKRALEQRVARMQRLEAVGTLAGGIAHDFNNILTYMFAYTDIVQGLLPADSPAAPHVDQLVAAIQRAADLVGQILTFSRQAQVDPHPLDLGPLVKEATKLVRASLPPSIVLDVIVPDRPFTVVANPTQMHEVVLNLLTNAHQAMASVGGRIVVRLDDEVLPSQDPRAGASLPAGAYRVLEVEDTGRGMDPRTLERVFEPFFTTKPVGQGTGMGLALVHGIVTSAGGAVLAESTPGEGTTFRVFLPRFEGQPVGTARDTPDARGQGRRVLFVDDERRVCETSQQLLESLGYRVRALTSGVDAIAEIEARGDEYDVVVTDLRMPDVGGLQVAEAARSRAAALPVVLTTAYADGITPEQARAAGVAEVLLKPFRRSDLARVLHGLLG